MTLEIGCPADPLTLGIITNPIGEAIRDRIDHWILQQVRTQDN